jgi:hypothetical protein
MEAMPFKPANIQEPTPAKRASRAWHFASDLAALGLHSSQHEFDGGRDGNAERFASSALGGGESQHTVFQIHAIEWNLSFTEATASSQGNLKADFHPFGHAFNGQGFPGDFNLIVRKNGFNSGYRAPFNSVIQKGNGVHFAQQSSLAVDPFQNLEILAGLVASSLAARGAGEALAPSQIYFTIICRKRLQTNFFLTNKSRQMTPRIFVINFCQRANGVIFNQIINPVLATIFSLFVNAKSSCVSRCLGAMESIVRSVAGAFATPFSSRVFKTYKEPRAAAFLVRIRHGDNGNIYLV